MRFLGRCLLFGMVLVSGSGFPVGVLSEPTPDPLSVCSGIKTVAEAQINGIVGLSTASINVGNSAALPALLQTCITNDSNTGKVIRIVLQVYKTQGANYPSDSTVWSNAGWPTSAVRIPNVLEYGTFVGLLGTLGLAGSGGSIFSNSTGGNGNGGNFDPNIIPACAGKSFQDCATFCTANNQLCIPNAGGSGNNPPPYTPPNPADLLKQYQQALGTIGTCQTSCPNNLLCIGSTCLPPQPRCDQQCTPQQFCKPKLSPAAIAQFNGNATAGAFAGAGAGAGAGNGGAGAGAGAQGSITLGDNTLVMPGGVVSGVCAPLTPVCNATSCPAGQVCAPFDGCKPCAACGNVPGLDLGALLAGGFDPSQLSGNLTLPPGQNQGQGQQIPPGIIAQIQGGSSQYGQVVFGSSASGPAASGNAVTAVAGGARAAADQLLANIRDAALQLAADAQLLANSIQVAANATLEVVLAAQNSQAGATQSVAINGPLVIRGPGNQVDPTNFTPQGVFNFPATANGNTVGTGAVVNAAGGVGLTGDLGSLTLSINAIASAAAAVAVPAGQFLRSSGQVLGSAAQVIVQGMLELRNAGFQPAVNIAGSGNVTVAVGRNGNFSCGSLAIQAGGKLDLWSNGSSTYFANLTRCDASALIRIRVDSIALLRANGGSAIAFGYGAVNASVKASLKCGAQLYDGTDSITLANPNAATGRRLLAAADGSTITFQDQNAQYTVPSSSSTSSSSTGGSGGNNSNSVSAVTPATAGLVMGLLATIIAIQA